MRYAPVLLALVGCSLLDWDELTEANGGATSSATVASTSSEGGCVGDAGASALTLTLGDGVHCYRRVHDGLQWALADLQCQATYGGHLLTIDDVAEFGVHEALYPADCPDVTSSCSDDPGVPSDSRCDDRAWTGGRFVSGVPTWTTGVAFTWPETVFAAGEPNERIEPIALRTERLLDERPNNCPHAYICEIDP